MKSYDVNAWLCPNCGYLMDTATKVLDASGGGPPEDGCFSMCLACGAVLVFQTVLGRLIQRRVTPAEFLTLSPVERNVINRMRLAQAALPMEVRMRMQRGGGRT